MGCGGRRSHQLLLRRYGARLSDVLAHRQPQTRPRDYLRSHLLSSKPNNAPPTPHVTSAAPAVSSSAAASVCSPFSSAARSGFVSWYLGMIESRPVVTKSLTAAAIFTAADVSSQTITRGPSDSLDFIRTLRMAGYGLLISGPSLHMWFNFVSRILPKRDLITTFKKIFLGQAVYGPIITTVFFSLNAGLQGETVAEIIARLKRDLLPTFRSGLMYWPMCDFITFKFIPVHLQPLVCNSFSFLWTIYVTYMAGLQKASVENITTE